MDFPPPTFLENLLFFISSRDQEAFRRVSKLYNKFYQEYWSRRALEEFNQGTTLQGEPITSQGEFQLAYQQCLSPGSPVTKTGLITGPGIRPLVSQCMQAAGFKADSLSLARLRSQGVDPLMAFFGAAEGNQIKFLKELQKLNPDLQTKYFAALGFLARGDLDLALEWAKPEIDWVEEIVRYNHLNLLPEVVEVINQSEDVQLGQLSPIRPTEVGEVLALYGHLEEARNWGYRPTNLEIQFWNSGEDFRQALLAQGQVPDFQSAVDLIIANEKMEYLPIILNRARELSRLDEERLLSMLLTRVVRDRKFHLLPLIPLPRITRGTAIFIGNDVWSSRDRDLLEWYWFQPGANRSGTLRYLATLPGGELYDYFTKLNS